MSLDNELEECRDQIKVLYERLKKVGRMADSIHFKTSDETAYNLKIEIENLICILESYQ